MGSIVLEIMVARRWLFTVAGLAIAPACGGDAGSHERPDPSDGADAADAGLTAPWQPVRSGERLRAVFRVVDGQRELSHFEDTDQGAPCMFQTAGEVTRCLPVGGHRLSYIDAACTEPVAFAYTSCNGTLSPFAIEYGTTCPLRPAVYRIGAAIAPPQQTFLMGSDGVCSPAPPTGAQVWRKLAEEIPLEEFVAETARLPANEGRLVAEVLVAADGARLPVAIRDTLHDVSCHMRPASDGVERCVPIGLDTSYQFSDSSCQSPVAVRSTWSECQPLPRFVRSPDLCSGRTHVHETAGRIADPDLFAMSSDGCSPSAAQPGATYHAVGREIEPTAFAQTTRERIGDGRIKQEVYRLAEGITGAAGWHDSQRDHTCSFRTAADGELRCLPPAIDIGSASSWFADDRCERRLALSSSCADVATRFAREYDWGSCQTRIFDLGEVTELVVVYRRYSDGTCGASEPPVGASIRIVGDEIDPAEFASAVLIRE